MQKNYFKSPIKIILVLTLGTIVFSSCQSVDTESGLKKQFSNIAISQEELRLRLNEYAVRFSGEIITAADAIKNNTDDLQIKQNALLWKMNSIPAANKVLFTIDPYAATVDMYAFAHQMYLFFYNGYGKDLFGNDQDIAIETSKNIEMEVVSLINISALDSAELVVEEKIHEFAETNPIKNLNFSRKSTIDFFAKFMADHNRSISSSVGSMEIAVSDLSMRLNIYYDQLPKIASWNVEYLTNQARMSGELDSLQSNMATITKSFERLAETGEQAESIINSSIARSFEELVEVREKILEELKIERAIILESVTVERTAVMNEINKQRLETITQLEDMLNSSILSATLQMEDIVDYIFIRVLVLLVIGYVIVIFTIRYFKREKSN